LSTAFVLQPDPKEFAAGDYNLYRYCHNDPVNRTDPDGLVDLSYTPSSDTAHVWEDSFNPTDRFTVAGHANSQGIVVNNKLLTADQVAKDMVAKGYTPDKPALIVACETGKGERLFRQQVSEFARKDHWQGNEGPSADDQDRERQHQRSRTHCAK
jgi:hypothetical protein